jgi:hypothetical protein
MFRLTARVEAQMVILRVVKCCRVDKRSVWMIQECRRYYGMLIEMLNCIMLQFGNKFTLCKYSINNNISVGTTSRYRTASRMLEFKILTSTVFEKLLRAFACRRKKPPVSCVTSVRPFAWSHSAATGRIFVKFLLRTSIKICRKKNPYFVTIGQKCRTLYANT